MVTNPSNTKHPSLGNESCIQHPFTSLGIYAREKDRDVVGGATVGFHHVPVGYELGREEIEIPGFNSHDFNGEK
ncbi:hypothetical protein PS2_019335 [Malus domestica]